MKEKNDYIQIYVIFSGFSLIYKVVLNQLSDERTIPQQDIVQGKSCFFNILISILFAIRQVPLTLDSMPRLIS